MQETISSNDPVGSHTLQVIATAEKFNKWMFEEFKDHLHGEILEIGSGIGNISDFVIHSGHNITVSDVNHEYVEYLREKYHNNPSVKRVVELDLLDKEFINIYNGMHQRFDTIFLLNVIEHLQDDSLALKNCGYLLKPGGRLIVLAPAHQWLFCRYDRELGHFRRYSMRRMTSLLNKNGFGIIHKKHFNAAGIAGWLVMGKLLSRNQLKEKEMSAFNLMVPLAKWIDKVTLKKLGLSLIVTAIKQ